MGHLGSGLYRRCVLIPSNLSTNKSVFELRQHHFGNEPLISNSSPPAIDTKSPFLE